MSPALISLNEKNLNEKNLDKKIHINKNIQVFETQVFETTDGWFKQRNELKAHDRRIGFVPTMGALHQGHLALVEHALYENDYVLVSIFVNPTQFNNKEDLKNYPRTHTQDINSLSKTLSALYAIDGFTSHGLGVILPSENEIYKDNYRYKISENETSKILCGAFRPGHFDGVLTVVMKLLGIAQAANCYMGEKDYQQFLLAKEMAENFFLPTKIISRPTVREDSGLAMSSRNERLSPDARKQAAILYKLLMSKKTIKEIQQQLEQSGFKLEYLEERWGRRFIAAWIDNVRLIDNVQIIDNTRAAEHE